MRVRKYVTNQRKSNQKNGSPSRCKSGSSSYASAYGRTRSERPSFSYQKFFTMRVRKNKKQWEVAEVQVSYKPKHDPSVKISTAQDGAGVATCALVCAFVVALECATPLAAKWHTTPSVYGGCGFRSRVLSHETERNIKTKLQTNTSPAADINTLLGAGRSVDRYSLVQSLSAVK